MRAANLQLIFTAAKSGFPNRINSKLVLQRDKYILLNRLVIFTIKIPGKEDDFISTRMGNLSLILRSGNVFYSLYCFEGPKTFFDVVSVILVSVYF